MADAHFNQDRPKQKPASRVEKTCLGCGCSFSVCITHATQRFHSRSCAQVHIHKPPADRFWDKVNLGADDACWEWVGGQRNLKGYGVFRDPARRRCVLAHRFAWELTRGAITAGLFVCHHCDNPGCVNPGHLFIGTAADNSHDMHRKGRARNGIRPVGVSHHAAKLSEDDVLVIRASTATLTHLARRFGVGLNTIRRVRIRETWAHL